MSSIAISSNASGTAVFTLASPATNTNQTLTLPDATGTVLTTATAGVPVNGPAFSAYPSASVTISTATYTKVILNTEDFDTASAFDSTTNYRFLPLVAGYYQINMTATMSQSTSNNTNSFVALYKNGISYKRAGQQNTNGQPGNSSWPGLVYLNGSTDYIEMYVYTSNDTVYLNAVYSNFSGFLARSAL